MSLALSLFFGPDQYVPAWQPPLSEPVRQKPSLPTTQQQFLALQPAPSPFVATGWFNQWQGPARVTLSLSVAHQLPLTWPTQPPLTIGWFEALSEPAKLKISFPVAQQTAQNFVFTPPTAEIITLDKWYQVWLTPKPATNLNVSQQQAQPYFETQQFPETVTESRWHYAWSEPVRFKPILLTPIQLFYTSPPRLMPNPSVSGTWSSIEVKDRLLFSEQLQPFNPFFNQPVSAKVGVVEVEVPSLPGANIGFRQ